MNKKLTIAIVILILILASALTGLFFALFEERDTERDIGLQGEAAFNPLLIAQRFLENSGIESESVVSMLKLKELPAQKDILFLATRRFDIGPVLRDKIMNWVASGGHLIIVAWPQSDSDSELQDPILESLKISVEHETLKKIDPDTVTCDDEPEQNKSKSEKDTKQKQKKMNSCKDNEFKPISVTILQDREKSKVAFDPSTWLSSSNENKSNWTISGDNGAHLIEYIKDKGLITVLSDYRFLTNKHLDKYDHAAFFWYLVHYSNNSGKVWIVYKGDMPPLYKWLFENLWAPFLTLFFIIAVWIWTVLPRFGAMYPEAAAHRRNLIEHIRASGQFLWKNKFSEGLIHETRNALQEQITKRHPNWNKLTETEIHVKLATQSGITVENVALALSTKKTTKENEFFLIIQTLERLRKSI